MARTNGTPTVILSASLAFTACEVSDPPTATNIVAIVAANGINPNGINPNGINPNGINPNGINPNGIWTGGVTIDSGPIYRVVVVGTQLRGEYSDGTVIQGEDFIGAELQGYFEATGR